MKEDDEIRKNVIEEIQGNPQLTKIAPQIGVIVKDEVVTLVGKVIITIKNLPQKRRRSG